MPKPGLPLSVRCFLTWLSVVGMSLSIMGAGAVIDGGGSELILWGVILTFATIMIRTMVVARVILPKNPESGTASLMRSSPADR